MLQLEPIEMITFVPFFIFGLALPFFGDKEESNSVGSAGMKEEAYPARFGWVLNNVDELQIFWDNVHSGFFARFSDGRLLNGFLMFAVSSYYAVLAILKAGFESPQ